MAPKKGGKGKGKSGGMIIDGVDTSQMTREQLELFCHRIKEENEREREERNFFQLERDKIRTFWEITKSELEETRAKLRNKERQIEEEAEKNQDDLRFYKQKVKYLQYEHQNNLTENKAETLTSLKLAQDDHDAQERELLKDKNELKRALRELEYAHQDQIRAIKIQHSEEITKLRQDLDTKAKDVIHKYDEKVLALRNELELKHNMEMSEIEERKNNQINELVKHHDTAFNDLKNYYNDITLNNLALISSLKDQMEVLRKQNERMSKQLADVFAENRRLAEPLKQAQMQIAEYKRMLQNYEKDKLALTNTRARFVATKKELENLKWERDALELRFANLQAEMDELSKRFLLTVQEVEQKTGLKNVLLQKRIEELVHTMSSYAASAQANINQLTDTDREHLMEKIDDLLLKKNLHIKELHLELAKVCKAHDDLLDAYEQKLVAYGIPKEELGFIPLRLLPEGQAIIAHGPAGLVTKNI